MTLKNPYIGEGYVPAYQLSAIPYVTSSVIALGETRQINFGHVTKFLIVRNDGPTSAELAVAFTQNGLKTANSNFFILSGSQSLNADLRTDRLFLSGAVGSSNFSVIAGLTAIEPRNFVVITGSNGHLGVG